MKAAANKHVLRENNERWREPTEPQPENPGPLLRLGTPEPLTASVFAKFFALANFFESPRPQIRILDENGCEEWFELHEEHPAVTQSIPSLSPFKW